MREVFRQAHGSGIIQSAHAINAGRVPDLLPVPPTLDHPAVHAALHNTAAPQHAAPTQPVAAGHAVSGDVGVPVDAVWVRLPSGGGGVQDNGAEVVAAVNQVIVGLGDMNVDVTHDVQVGVGVVECGGR